MRHGPHQAAQKSTRTGTLLWTIISSNSSWFTSRGSATGGRGALHAPHLPVSARCFAGTRFGFLHAGHSLTTAMALPFLGLPVDTGRTDAPKRPSVAGQSVRQGRRADEEPDSNANLPCRETAPACRIRVCTLLSPVRGHKGGFHALSAAHAKPSPGPENCGFLMLPVKIGPPGYPGRRQPGESRWFYIQGQARRNPWQANRIG